MAEGGFRSGFGGVGAWGDVFIFVYVGGGDIGFGGCDWDVGASGHEFPVVGVLCGGVVIIGAVSVGVGVVWIAVGVREIITVGGSCGVNVGIDHGNGCASIRRRCVAVVGVGSAFDADVLGVVAVGVPSSVDGGGRHVGVGGGEVDQERDLL